MRVIGLVAILGLAGLQAGCATMTRSECIDGNWRRIGYQDGTMGYPPSRIGEHERACAAHGVPVDARAYLESREQGLEVYCTPQRGFSVGSDGRSYAGVCPRGLEEGFLAGYADGRFVHDASQAADQARSDASAIEHRIRQLRKDIDQTRERIGAEGLAERERDALRAELRRLREDMERAERDLVRAERAREAAEREFDRARRRFAPLYSGW